MIAGAAIVFFVITKSLVINVSMRYLLSFCEQSFLPESTRKVYTLQGHPTAIFGKISVRKTI